MQPLLTNSYQLATRSDQVYTSRKACLDAFSLKISHKEEPLFSNRNPYGYQEPVLITIKESYAPLGFQESLLSVP